MNSINNCLNGLASSLFLALGLNRLAEKFEQRFAMGGVAGQAAPVCWFNADVAVAGPVCWYNAASAAPVCWFEAREAAAPVCWFESKSEAAAPVCWFEAKSDRSAPVCWFPNHA